MKSFQAFPPRNEDMVSADYWSQLEAIQISLEVRADSGYGQHNVLFRKVLL